MNKLTLAAAVLGAFALQGCIIYEDDHCDGDCEWEWDDDGDWCDEDGRDQDGEWCDDPGDDTDDPEPEPAFDLFLDPGQAEQGETFLATLTAEGEFLVSDVTSVRFTGGLEVLYQEVREDQVLILVDVPASADLGPADLVISRAEAPAVLFESALVVGEPDSGNSADDCE